MVEYRSFAIHIISLQTCLRNHPLQLLCRNTLYMQVSLSMLLTGTHVIVLTVDQLMKSYTKSTCYVPVCAEAEAKLRS